ncbi:PAS domain S-box protein [Phototrophicus methaneseepsis]|uniref:histidine kinase n=1 Tax=Phototrophicus methaneseepsis TaxID=2710758 RepID=A0A7S8ECE2_9CHLR|nr:PAS domain S-box protein [Phototrophicus methaneseepsis]QPC84158.1 PAS domain S-box protein [Phototrophicus methaneseepsis]
MDTGQLQQELLHVRQELETAYGRIAELEARIPSSNAAATDEAVAPSPSDAVLDLPIDLSWSLDRALNAFPAGVVILDHDGTIILHNQAWHTFTEEIKKHPSHYQGVRYTDLYKTTFHTDAEDTTRIMNGLQAVTSGQRDTFFVESMLPGMPDRWVSVRALPLSETVPRSILIVHTDITDQKATKDELLSLYNATSYLFKADSLPKLGRQIVDAVVKEFAHADCGLLLVDREKNEIIRVARAGEYGIQTTAPLLIEGNGLVPLAIRTGQTIYVPDVVADEKYIANDSRTRSELVVPLKGTEGVIAALDLQHSKIDAFTEYDKRLLTAYAERAAAAIENVLLYEKINRHAADLEQHVQDRTAQLQIQKERVEVILNNSADGILLMDKDIRIEQANRAFEKLFACEIDDYVGHMLHDFICADDIALIQEMLETHDNVYLEPYLEPFMEVCALRADGTSFPAEIAIGRTKGSEFVCTFRDVSDRKRAEEALAEERNLLRTLIDTLPDAVYLKDVQHRFLLTNKSHTQLWESEFNEDFIGKTDFDILPHAIAEDLYAEEVKMFQTGEPILNVELPSRPNDENAQWVSASKVPLKNLKGEVIGLVGIFHDITERKRRDRELQYYASVQASMSDAVIATDPEYHIQSWNPAAERIYGWRAEEAIGQHITKLLQTQFPSDEVRQHLQKLFEDRGHWQSELVHTCKDGSKVNIQSNVTLLVEENGLPLGLVVVNRDITQRKKAELALHQKIEAETAFQQRLKALHEITNELTAINDIDAFYKKVVEFGRDRLGFDRLALLLYDEEDHMATGTYGTDTDGQTSDEHHLMFQPTSDGLLLKALNQNERFAEAFDVPLHTAHQLTGTGWKAVGVIWHGKNSLGWLATDNGLYHQPPPPYMTDLLALYCITTGTLLAHKREQLALEESESLYRLIATNVADVVLRTNKDSEYVYISPSSLKTLGYTPEEMLGKKSLSFVHPDDLEASKNRRTHSVATGDAVWMITRFRHKKGHYIWTEIVGQAIVAEDKGHTGFIGTLRDITERKMAQEALEKTSEEIRDLYNNAPCGYHSLNPDGVVVQINDTELRWLGYTREEVVDKMKFIDFLLPRDYPTFHKNYPNFKKRGWVSDLEYDFVRKDGTILPIVLSATAIYDEDGEFIQTRSTVFDMTELKVARQALQAQYDFLQRVIDSVPTLILVKNREGEFELVNDAMAQIWGHTPKSMVGKSDPDINGNHAEVELYRKDDFKVLETGETLYIPAERIQGRYFQTAKIPLKNPEGEYDRVLIVASDVTKRKNAEEKLQLALEKEKELNELKSRFVSMASHEFRTPLATILALVETLKAYRHKLSDDSIAHKLEKMHEQIGHLEDIMDDVLQLARMQARRVTFNPVRLNLDSLCRSVLDEFHSHKGNHYDITYHCDPDLKDVVLDKKLMRQIINNLVSNAIKYTSHGQFSLTLEREKNALILKVSDHGIGIPESDQAHLFEPFHRASNVGTIAGTGLGLVITKEAVELHGGFITVDSQVDVGTTFTVTIPLQEG